MLRYTAFSGSEDAVLELLALLPVLADEAERGGSFAASDTRGGARRFSPPLPMAGRREGLRCRLDGEEGLQCSLFWLPGLAMVVDR